MSLCFAISIHAPHARSDFILWHRREQHRHFNPRSSCEERPICFATTGDFDDISIHAPHARSDPRIRSGRGCCDDFNPRSSCEERPLYPNSSISAIIFQSTLLMRGATDSRRNLARPGPYFNPRSSCEERPLSRLAPHDARDISIHAPHARSDRPLLSSLEEVFLFQSTLLMRGATLKDFASTAPASLFQSTLLMRGATCVNFRH